MLTNSRKQRFRDVPDCRKTLWRGSAHGSLVQRELSFFAESKK